MMYGVTIGTTNTLTTYGLFLCADISIEAPKLKEEWVNVPGANGALNYSYALTGEPTYERRKITFALAKSVGDSSLESTRATIAALWHGKEVQIKFPFDTSHYYKGVLSIGSLSGYNSGKIQCELNAEPFRYDSNGGTSL